MHGDEGRTEDKQQNGDVDHAGRLQGRPEDAGRVPKPRTHQVD